MKSAQRFHAPAVEFGRYFAASLVALAVDVAVLLAAAQFMHYLMAATLGFVVGSVISYLLATRWAFRRRRLNGRAHAEFAVYAVVGVLGLGINDLAMFLAVGSAGLPLLTGKLLAAGMTFVFNFILRKLVLF
jgi:putative flippase GtrA